MGNSASSSIVDEQKNTSDQIPALVPIGKILVPTENLLHVASYMDMSTLVGAFRTSKATYQVLNSEHVWQARCLTANLNDKPQDSTWKQYYSTIRIVTVQFLSAYNKIFFYIFIIYSSIDASALRYVLQICNKLDKTVITGVTLSSAHTAFGYPLSMHVPGNAENQLPLHVWHKDTRYIRVKYSRSRLVFEPNQKQQVEHKIEMQTLNEAFSGVTSGSDLTKCKIVFDFEIQAPSYDEHLDFDHKFSNPATEFEWKGGRLVSLNSLLVDWSKKTVQIQ